MRSRHTILFVILSSLLALTATAQTTTPGPGIDVEIVNPVDGSNNFCVQAGTPFWAQVWVQPGNVATSCSLGCGTVAGGTANLASASIEVGFDPGMFDVTAMETNPSPGTAAVDGLVRTANAASGRVGWSLAGDWVVDGDPSSGLEGPCTRDLLDSVGWAFRIELTATASGSSLLDLRRQPEFELSFADHCSTTAFTLTSGDLDELVPGFVTTSCSSQADILFYDGFDVGSTQRWANEVP